VAVGGLAGCTQESPSSEPASAAMPRMTTFAADDRKAAPLLRGPTLTGQDLDVAGYRGKVVVLNGWASWCQPCEVETPALVRVAKSTASSGVQFVGINTRDGARNGQAFAERFDVPYPSLHDPDGEVVVRFNRTVPPGAVPFTLILDRQGRIAVRVIGEVSEKQLRDALAPLVAEQA
jgi:thiol-disulfide isomerase/thioredoxin